MKLYSILSILGMIPLLQAESPAPLAGSRTRMVTDHERGSIFSSDRGDDWTTFGAVVGNASSIRGTLTVPDAVKVQHGRFHLIAPGDVSPNENGIGGGLNPELLRAFEQDEVAAGRPPLLVTATWKGRRRPVLWNWSVGFPENGDKADANLRYHKQAIHVGDPRWVRYWIHQYARPVLLAPLGGAAHAWVGTDECAFNPGLYGVVDGEGRWRGDVPWDRPFPQGEAAYYASIRAFYRQMRELAPDILIMSNLGTIGDPDRFDEVWADTPGVMLEDILSGNREAADGASRLAVRHRLRWLESLASRGAVGISRSMIEPKQDLEAELAWQYALYLLSRGENFFWDARDAKDDPMALDEARWRPLAARLGRPTGPIEVSESGKDEAHCLYSRPLEGGRVWLNLTGTTVDLDLPPGTWLDLKNQPVSHSQLKDGSALVLLREAGERAAMPWIGPRYGIGLAAAARRVHGPIMLTLRSPEPQSSVHYTLDGSEPGPGSPRSSGPLLLKKSTTVRAIAIIPGCLPSFVNEARYEITSAPPEARFHLEEDTAHERLPHHFPLISLSHLSSQPITLRVGIEAGSADWLTEESMPPGGPTKGWEVSIPPYQAYATLPLRWRDTATKMPERQLRLQLLDASGAELSTSHRSQLIRLHDHAADPKVLLEENWRFAI